MKTVSETESLTMKLDRVSIVSGTQNPVPRVLTRGGKGMIRQYKLALLRVLLGTFAVAVFASSANAAECKNRGDLDTRYCDENGDLVADTPRRRLHAGGYRDL